MFEINGAACLADDMRTMSGDSASTPNRFGNSWIANTNEVNYAHIANYNIIMGTST